MQRSVESGRRCGFTLVDAAAAVVSLGLIGLVLAPAVAGPSMRASWGLRSQQNLSIIGQASAVYVNEHDGLLPAYSWEGGATHQVYGNSSGSFAQTDQQAHSLQNTDLLRRLTGRHTDPATRIQPINDRLVDRQYTHLILADYFGWGPTPEFFAAPEDLRLQAWRADPMDLSGVPYAGGNSLDSLLYDTNPGWLSTGVKQRWAYGSSYHIVPAAWSLDALPSYAPASSTPHLFTTAGVPGGDIPLGGRRDHEATMPAHKVFAFEEFDWRPIYDPSNMTWASDGLYFAYPNARVGKLMFDGAVNDLPTSGSNPGWNPMQPTVPWTQTYRALDTFPLHRGQDPHRRLPQWFRWTRDGLAGIDYPVLGP